MRICFLKIEVICLVFGLEIVNFRCSGVWIVCCCEDLMFLVFWFKLLRLWSKRFKLLNLFVVWLVWLKIFFWFLVFVLINLFLVWVFLKMFFVVLRLFCKFIVCCLNWVLGLFVKLLDVFLFVWLVCLMVLLLLLFWVSVDFVVYNIVRYDVVKI